MKRIEIDIQGQGSALAELDGRNPSIADSFYQLLPLQARANLWGEEVYFEIPLAAQDENPSPTAVQGDISYWSPGQAFCIFFGHTQPYSPVNHIGRIVAGLDLLGRMKSGDRIVLNRK